MYSNRCLIIEDLKLYICGIIHNSIVCIDSWDLQPKIEGEIQGGEFSFEFVHQQSSVVSNTRLVAAAKARVIAQQSNETTVADLPKTIVYVKMLSKTTNIYTLWSSRTSTVPSCSIFVFTFPNMTHNFFTQTQYMGTIHKELKKLHSIQLGLKIINKVKMINTYIGAKVRFSRPTKKVKKVLKLFATPLAPPFDLPKALSTKEE
jgi:hypothetical protein